MSHGLNASQLLMLDGAYRDRDCDEWNYAQKEESRGDRIMNCLRLRRQRWVLKTLLGGVFALATAGAAFRDASGAEPKPAWQAEWEKVLAAAKKEGQVTVYISGYEEVLPDFQKEYPEIKVTAVTGRGSQVAQRMLAERRAEKFLADVFSSGGVTTHGQLYAAKVLDPIKPALILPEINDVTKWYQGKHHYNDAENQYVFSYVGSATYGSVSYNTKLADVKDFKSYWDLLNPKWKGKIISRDIRAPGPGSGNARLFYHLPDVGPSFIRKLYGEMDVTLFRDYRQGTDWLA
ncbi:MAG: ABC transporter substrate-binding protein, partial [Candidatus Binatia bacterium]